MRLIILMDKDTKIWWERQKNKKSNRSEYFETLSLIYRIILKNKYWNEWET
jgi:hypothetical protein